VNQTSIDDQVAMVVRRLAPSVDLPVATIEQEVRLAFDQWDEARVRDFVPIFVERDLRGRLAALGRSA
jgi:hypothetical protein